MADQNQNDKQIVEDENELKYQELIYLIEATKCMVPSGAKKDVFIKMKDEFIKLSDYKEAEEYAQKCSKLVEQVNDEIKIQTYEQAQKLKGKAKNKADYQSAAAEFRKVSGYKDADEMTIICEKM